MAAPLTEPFDTLIRIGVWVDVSRITPSEAQGWCITPFRPRKYQETRFAHCYQKEEKAALNRSFVGGAEGI